MPVLPFILLMPMVEGGGTHPGQGAQMKGEFDLDKGDVIKIVVANREFRRMVIRVTIVELAAAAADICY